MQVFDSVRSSSQSISVLTSCGFLRIQHGPICVSLSLGLIRPYGVHNFSVLRSSVIVP